MNEIVIEKPTKEKLEDLGVFDWPVWEKEVSSFPWTYDSAEVCYLLEGEACVTPQGGQAACFAAGDLVTFPEGMICMWKIKKPVKKHYLFA